MAGAIYTANTTAEVALVASSAKCLIRLIPPSSFQIKIKEWGVYFDGVSATAEPVMVQLCSVDTSYGWYTTHTPIKRSGKPTAAQTICQTANTSSSSPTIFGIYCTREVHPQSGYQEKFAYGDEICVGGLPTAVGGVAALIVTSPTTVNVMAEMVFEE
jgi:hypothetical protein